MTNKEVFEKTVEEWNKDNPKRRMENKLILQKAIEKALENGYEWDYIGWFPYEPIIFSHDFAKAFFGEEEGCKMHKFGCLTPRWKCHLQLLVIQEDPLQYLAKFLLSDS